MRILIGVLYSGENEYEQCLAALRSQRHRDWEHFVLKDLPKKQAHEQLYGEFMRRAQEFDLFLKLDADMVLVDEDRLSLAVELFERDPELDHVEIAVHDWIPDQLTMGLNIFRSRVHWPRRDEQLFTDLPPQYAGRELRFWSGLAPFVWHCPDPSPLQAFHYGVHRTLKAFANKRGTLVLRPGLEQWRLLVRTWRHFDRTRDQRLGLVLLGAEDVMSRRLSLEATNYGDDLLRERLSTYAGLTAEQMYEQLAPRWNRWWIRRARRMKRVVPLFFEQFVPATVRGGERRG